MWIPRIEIWDMSQNLMGNPLEVTLPKKKTCDPCSRGLSLSDFFEEHIWEQVKMSSRRRHKLDKSSARLVWLDTRAYDL